MGRTVYVPTFTVVDLYGFNACKLYQSHESYMGYELRDIPTIDVFGSSGAMAMLGAFGPFQMAVFFYQRWIIKR